MQVDTIAPTSGCIAPATGQYCPCNWTVLPSHRLKVLLFFLQLTGMIPTSKTNQAATIAVDTSNNNTMASTPHLLSIFHTDCLNQYFADFLTFQELLNISCTGTSMRECTKELLRNKRELKCLSFIVDSFPITCQELTGQMKDAVLCGFVKLIKWDTVWKLETKASVNGPTEYMCKRVPVQNANGIQQIGSGLERSLQLLCTQWIGQIEDNLHEWDYEEVNFPQHFQEHLCSNFPKRCLLPYPNQKTLYFYVHPDGTNAKKYCQHCVSNNVLLQLRIAKNQTAPFSFLWSHPNGQIQEILRKRSFATSHDVILSIGNSSEQLYLLVFNCTPKNKH